jgi:hypothetical protein
MGQNSSRTRIDIKIDFVAEGEVGPLEGVVAICCNKSSLHLSLIDDDDDIEVVSLLVSAVDDEYT